MKRLGFIVCVAVLSALTVLGLAVMAVTNTVQDDVCSAAFRECTAMAEGVANTVDCRIEVYHCRSAGHFEFPDGTVRRFPANSADVGEN